MSYKTKEASIWQQNVIDYIKEQINIQNWDYPVNKTQHFYVDCVFYFPRTDMDCNNYFKCLLDAITDSKCIWEDDNVVCERVNGIYYDSCNPRIEIQIKPTEYIGIFKNKSELKNFISICETCNRYKRNCSILKSAKEGRIQEDIQGCKCTKYKQIKN